MFKTTDTLNSECHPQPRVTALLASGDNFMPLSWHMPVSKSPFRYAVAIRNENKSYEIVKQTKEFSLNFIDFSYAQTCEIAGSSHGGDKFATTGLSQKHAHKIKSSLIEQAYMIYEC